MERQPAKINYFFKGGYVELWNTIRGTFSNLGEDIADAWEVTAEGWCTFWESIFSAIGSIFSMDFEWDEIWESIKGICIFSYGLGNLIYIIIVTTGLCLLLSLAHTVILLFIMAIAYTMFLFWLTTDAIYCSLKHISSNCDHCQAHFSLPIYLCPNCGVAHTKLRPSKYGIWKRKCECGCKLPTTFFNGKGKLEAHCPSCNHRVEDGGAHEDIFFPVIGGPSSGKTCFIHQSIASVERVAPDHGLEFKYLASDTNTYEDGIRHMNQGYLPEKTNEMRLNFYRFYLNASNAKVKTLVSLCDVGGEIYQDAALLGTQTGYKHANGFLMIIDPLAIDEYRSEIEKNGVDPKAYGYSSQSIDETISMLTTTLGNVFCRDAKDMLKNEIAVVFTKGDVPGLSDKIGDPAVEAYLQVNPTLTRYEAQNAVCEAFLAEYGEINFTNTLKSKFKNVQYFTASSLGHNSDGTPFEASGVDDPVLWLIDRTSVSVNFKSK